MTGKTTVISQDALNVQFDYCDKISAYWREQAYTPKAYVETYGYQQN